MKVESRKFEASPHIIYSLIKAQAGSLAKGLLEATMNSADAGATEVNIEMTETSLVIADNGKGFVSKQEILEVFEVFGWEHAEGQRTYGRFGIGRAQLWNFCSTKWVTNSFVMDVDIKTKGLNYDLMEDAPHCAGLRIEGQFYERQTLSDLSETAQELSDLVKYCPIKVTLNGKEITSDVSKVKWTHDLPEAYVLLNDRSELAVYNLGVLVRKYPARWVGSGGVVVSKAGHPFVLNMARNDVLQSECKLWKKIKPLLQNLSDERIAVKRTRLNTTDYIRMAQRIKDSEGTNYEINELKVLPMITGKMACLREIKNRLYSSKEMKVFIAPKGHKAMQALHDSFQAVVFNEDILTYFEIETASELQVILSPHFGHLSHKLQWVDDYRSALTTNDEYRTVPKEEVLPMAAMVLSGLYEANRYISNVMETAQRRLIIGQSDRALMWTDGKQNIWIDQGVLVKGGRDFQGFLNLAHILVHEYVHDHSDVGSHDHDLEFYERFHQIMTNAESAAGVFNAAKMGFKKYLSSVYRKDGKVSKKADMSLESLDDGLAIEASEEFLTTKAQAKQTKKAQQQQAA